MAIVNAAGGGVAQKSADNKTFRMVRGRIVMSRKRPKGASGATTRGQSGNIRKPLFAMLNMFMMAHASDIQVSFNKSRYGSQRNYFFTVNYKGFTAALKTLATVASSTGELPTLAEIEAAITEYATANPTVIYRVKLNGFALSYMSGAWSSDDNPISGGSADGLGSGTAKTAASGDAAYIYDAPTSLSMSFNAGAKIVREAGHVTLTGAAIPSGIDASAIVYLTSGGVPVAPAVTVTDVTSQAGNLQFDAPELPEASNVLAILVGSIHIRLVSAYVRTGEHNPLG